MKVLITGATGLIGDELTKLLLQNGIKVNYLTTSKNKIENQPNYKGFYWNPVSGIIDENCINDVQVIINLAGSSIAKRWTKNYKDELIESRVSSLNLLYKTLQSNTNQVEQIISASAIGIYPSSISRLYKEDFEKFEDNFLTKVVLKWEESANQFEVLGVKVCKLRIGLVLSNKGGALPQLVKPLKMYAGTIMGTGKQYQSWIHIQDLVEIFMFALNNSLEGVFNAVAPNPLSHTEFMESLSKVIGKPILLPKVPQIALKMILGEMETLLTDSQKVSSKKIIDSGFEFQYKYLFSALQQLLQK